MSLILRALAALGLTLGLSGFVFTPPISVTKVVAAYVGPGDKVASASMWWGLRGYNAAFSGTVGQICDAATGLVCANMTWSGGVLTLPLIGGIACNNSGAICVVSSLADQTGNGFTINQTTNAARPTLVVAGAANGCPTTAFPCMAFVRGNTQCLQAGSAYTQSQPFSFEWVGVRTGTTASAQFAIGFAALISAGWAGANTARVAAGSALNLTSVTDSSWHAGQAVANSTSGNINVDGASGTGNTGSSGTSTTPAFGGQPGNCNNTASNMLDGKLVEGGVWPIAFSAGNISDLNSNAHSYWGF